MEADLEKVVKAFANRRDSSSASLRVLSESKSINFSMAQESGYVGHFVASTTKTMMATLALALEAKGKIRLADSISAYLSPDELSGLCVFRGQDHRDSVTIEALLRNTSGIPNYFKLKRLKSSGDVSRASEADPGWTFAEAITLSKSLKSRFDPNSGKAEYSFTNYQIASEIFERATGSPLASLLQENIFEPLGMESSFLFTFDQLEKFSMITPMLIGRQPYMGSRRMASLRGEGAVVSTLDDTLKFSQALYGGGFIPDDNLNRMNSQWKPIFPGINYGMGVMKLSVPALATGLRKLPPLYGHSGASGHFMFFESNSKTHIIGTVNQIGDKTLGLKMLLKVGEVLFS